MSNSNPPLATTQSPIAPYLKLLSDTSDLSSIQSIILKCISDPKIYVGFNEISNLPSIQQSLHESNSSIGPSLSNTLDLFSYGVYLDYQKQKERGETKYVTLNDAQEWKLKLLTVVSVVHQVLEESSSTSCTASSTSNDDDGGTTTTTTTSSSSTTTTTRSRHRRKHRTTHTQKENDTNHPSKNTVGIVPYSTLQKALGMEHATRDFEHILIQCIYADLLPMGTKLDQKHHCIIVRSASSSSSSSSPPTTADAAEEEEEQTYHTTVLCRDVNIAKDLPSMISKLDAFYKRSEHVKYNLHKALNDLNTGLKEDVDKWKSVDEIIQMTKDQIAGDHRIGGMGGSSSVYSSATIGSSNMMDIVENQSMFDMSPGKRHSKRSRGGRPGRLNFGNKG